MAHVHGKGLFKLEFVCIRELLANGEYIRSVVLVAGDIPGQPNFVLLVLAYENGNVMQKTVRKEIFEGARLRGDCINMVEAPNLVVGAPVLLGADGSNIGGG